MKWKKKWENDVGIGENGFLCGVFFGYLDNGYCGFCLDIFGVVYFYVFCVGL